MNTVRFNALQSSNKLNSGKQARTNFFRTCHISMASADMSGVNGNGSLDQEIDNIRECIERCLQMYMSKTETINFLAQHNNIQPALTSTVWMRLAEDNPEFFRAYNVRLAVQEQIIEFNRLLSEQAELTRLTELSAANNAFQFHSKPSFTTQQISTPDAVQGSMNPEPGNRTHVYAFNDYAPLIQVSTQRAFDGSVHFPNMFLPQSSSSLAPDFSFGRRSNFVGLNSWMGEYPSVSPYSSGFSLSTNDNVIFSGLSGNVEMLDPRSTGGWRNPYFIG